jgi:PAS domain S-box-containing protein
MQKKGARAEVLRALSVSSWAWLVLLLSLLLTLWAWYDALEDVSRLARERFAFRMSEIETAIHDRMLSYEQVLRGGIGLFRASREVERDEWSSYVAALRIDKNYPGIRAIGYAHRFSGADKDRHIAATRAEGFATYTVWPHGERDEYFPIVFIEPLDEANLRALGFDMFAERTRNAAMRYARDQATTVVSNKVVLVQEDTANPQAGLLMYLPLYRKGAVIDTLDDRREALQGFIYGAFRIRDLIRGIFGADDNDISLAIYEGNVVSPDSLLFGTQVEEGTPVFRAQKQIALPGNVWTVIFTAGPQFAKSTDQTRPILILAFGLIVSLALSAMLWSFAHSRERAIALAERMSASAKKSEERARLIVDTAHEAFLSFDAKGVIHDWNKQAETIFGWKRHEAIGRDVVGLLTPNAEREPGRDAASAFLKAGNVRILDDWLEMTVTHKDEHQLPVEFTITPLEIEEGLLYNVFLRDVSGRRRAEQEIKALNADLRARALQLEATNKELESFSYSVSHDLRSPLRAISGFSRILEEDYTAKLDAEGKRILSVIRDGSHKMGQLIDDLLNFSRLGRQAIVAQEIDMARLANEAFQEARPQGAKVRFNLHAMPNVHADRALIKQVWMNLFANAIKFSGNRPAPCVEAGGRNEGNEAIFHVKDNGAGFDMRYRDKLFGVFQRLHSDFEFPGTGVGLAIVHRVITRHGGRTWAESTAGQGATFYFSLPHERSS